MAKLTDNEFVERMRNVAEHLPSPWRAAPARGGLLDRVRCLRIENGKGAVFTLTYDYPYRLAHAHGEYPRVGTHTFDPHSTGALAREDSPHRAGFDPCRAPSALAADLMRRFVPTFLALHAICAADAEQHQRVLEATRREAESMLQRGPFERRDLDLSNPGAPTLRFHCRGQRPFVEFRVCGGEWEIELRNVPGALASSIAEALREHLIPSAEANPSTAAAPDTRARDVMAERFTRCHRHTSCRNLEISE